MVEIVGLVVLFVVFALQTVCIPKVWSGVANWDEQMPERWPWGESAWRGMVRAFPVGTVALWAMWLGYVLVTFTSVQRIGTILGFVFVGCGAVCASIWWFNRPRFLVPPRHRADSGAIRRR
jgi:hypothetical protein